MTRLQDFFPKFRDKIKTVNRVPLFLGILAIIIFMAVVIIGTMVRRNNINLKGTSVTENNIIVTDPEVFGKIPSKTREHTGTNNVPGTLYSSGNLEDDPLKAFFRNSEFDLVKEKIEREKEACLCNTSAWNNSEQYSEYFSAVEIESVKEIVNVAGKKIKERELGKRKYPESKFTISLGTLIPAVLETGINSQLPGMIKALVSDDVYDSATGQYLLIPKGSRLIGTYASDISMGQNRVMIAWNRINLPDTSYVDVNRMTGTDLAGLSGVKDKVDNHYIRIFSNAVLLSLISAGVDMTVPESGEGESNLSKFRDSLNYSLGQNLGQTASDILRRQMDVQPTVEIRSGYEFLVIVNEDIPFKSPYKPYEYTD